MTKDRRALFYNILIIFGSGKMVHHCKVVHFLKNRCIVAFFVRNLIFLTEFSVWAVLRFIVFLGWYQCHGLWKRVE